MRFSPIGFMRRYMRNEDGVISVMAVGALVLAFAVAMIVIDTGAMYSAYRYQQSATDAAALGAVRQIGEAQSVAETIFNLNEYSTENITATPLYYVADPSLAPNGRFFSEGETASDGTLVNEESFNAVRVTKQAQSPTYFARLFGFGNSMQVETQAVAAYTKYVSFSAGTRLASLDAGIANQVLGGLLGTTINLSLIDYNSLVDANIDALEFLDALATEIGLEAGTDTYGDLLEAGASVGDILNAAVDVLTGDTFDGDPSVATLALQTALSPVGGTPVDLGDVLDLAPIAQRTIGSVGSSLSEGVPFNLFNLLSGTAMALGEGQAVGFDTDVNLGSLASVSGTITVGSPVAHMAIGKVGDSVRTSQVAVQMNASIGVPLLGRVLQVPIFIDAGDGTAEVKSIPCVPDGTQVILAATTSGGTVRYGTSSTSGATISIPLLLSFQLSGSVPIAAGGPKDVSFEENEFSEVKSTSSDVALISGLSGSTQITNLSVLGILNLTPLGTITSSLLSSIIGALAGLDTVVDSLLAALGIKLGAMDMIVHGTKCQAPTLVS
ncbi:TadG family pilus assembly protein [Parvibaculum sp.]|uniref:TadG family pilus assembly protein n=1 Tax=Parvibaculum sp. TaxID=2024848 RepID=UPI00329956F4